jgi:co-chaperonin GroES (HSP10)
MGIKLLRHHVLVKLEDATEADEAYRRAKALGIELALDKRVQEAVEVGEVVQIGPTAFKDLGFDMPPIKVGDKVSLIRYVGKKIQDTEGNTFYIYNDDDLLAIIE